jgi:hypothetical protein
MRDDGYRLCAFLAAQEYQEVGGNALEITEPEVQEAYNLSRAILVDVQDSYAQVGANRPDGVPRYILFECFPWTCDQFWQILPPSNVTWDEMENWKRWIPVRIEGYGERKQYFDQIYANNS